MLKNAFIKDLKIGMSLWRAILFISWGDVRARYKRSFLGPLWIVLTLGLGSAGLGILWSVLWNAPLEELLPPVTIGFLVWIFVSSSIVEGSTCFTQNAHMIQNLKLPLCYFPLISYAKQIVNFVHSWLIILIVLIIYPPQWSLTQLWVLPGLALVVIDLFLLVYLFGVLSARYRDIQLLISSIMPLLFFLSPVLFKLKQAEDIAWLILINPLTYLITILRDPIIGEKPDWIMYVPAIFLGLVTFLILLILIHKKHNSIVNWV